jgi:hypothetical protein
MFKQKPYSRSIFMTEFLSLFIFGTFWFWTVSLIFLIIAVVFTEHESGIGALVTLTLYILYFQLLAKINFLGWLFEKPANFFIAIGSYLIIGLIWSCVKWWLLVSHIAEKEKDRWADFLKKNDLPENTKTLPQRLFDDWSSSSFKYRKPEFSKNKDKITLWVTYWPLSMVYSLLRDFIIKVIRRIVLHFQKIYEKIANNAFKDIDKISIEKKEINRK